MKLTLAMITARAEPRLNWLLTSLAPQVTPKDEIDVLVIDAQGRSPAELGARSSYSYVPINPQPRTRRFVDTKRSSKRPSYWVPKVRTALPKPTPWQGAHRITSCDWWAKSSAMNTALVLCETDYIAFVDDCCRLGPKWLETVRRGEKERRSVLAGTYDKVERGVVVQDHRRVLVPEGKQNCGGGWLYGCTFALPLEWALEVNGAEEGCDGMGAEDYTLGFALSNNGRQIDFVPSLAVTLERPEISNGGSGPSIPLRRHVGEDRRQAALARFRGLKRTEFSPDLRELRAAREAGELVWPKPDPEMKDWFDGASVREMK